RAESVPLHQMMRIEAHGGFTVFRRLFPITRSGSHARDSHVGIRGFGLQRESLLIRGIGVTPLPQCFLRQAHPDPGAEVFRLERSYLLELRFCVAPSSAD